MPNRKRAGEVQPAAVAPITKINLKLLQTFLLVAEHGSFREAAARARLSQSAISMQIKQLETQLGLSLFHRTTREVRLTKEGEQLLFSTQRGFHEVSIGIRKVQEALDIKRGRVSLACSPTIATVYMPRVLAAFESDYPGINIQLRELKSVDLFEALRRGDVDFAVGPLVDDPDFDFQTVLVERMFALVPKALAGNHRSTITVKALAEMPILHTQVNTTSNRLTETAAREQGVVLNVRYRCIQHQTLVALAEAGLGAAILTESIVRIVSSPNLRALHIIEPSLAQPFSIIKQRGQMLAPAAARLAEIIEEKFAQVLNQASPTRPRSTD